MISDKVKVDGARVVIETDSEHTARALGAAADRQRIQAEGSVGEKIELWIEGVGDRLEALVDGLNRPSLGVMSWVLAVVAGVMAYMSFGRLMPSLESLFGIVGVIVVLVVKIATARWAKADNLNAPKIAATYQRMAFGGVALIFVVSVAFQAAVDSDVESGSVAIELAVEREDSAIRQAEFKADQLVRPQDASEILLQDIERRLGQTAQNRAGDPTPMTIGQAVGAGPRNEQGLMPDTFCMPNKDRQFYIDRYCEQLVDMEKGYQRRLVYDRAMAEISKRKADNEAARKKAPRKSSSLALADRAGTGDEANIWGIFFVALGMLFVECGMVFCAYFSKRHPKGVTAGLAALSQQATTGAGGATASGVI